MFSRSKSDDSAPSETLSDSQAPRRRPALLAVLAGLLAIAGTLLLITSLASDDEPEEEAVTEVTQQVLTVTQTIPSGTDVNELLESPSTWLAARAVPEQFVAESAVGSIEELTELSGLTLASDALPGEQLLTERFLDRNDFQSESFLDRQAAAKAPEGHHTVVLNLAAEDAMGGNVRPGDKVTVVGSFRVDPGEAETFPLSIVVLPTVEVVNVETSAEVVGEISETADVVGRATVGDFAITLAVEPAELTDLVYAMEYGEIVLAVALEDAVPLDDRSLSTMQTLLGGDDYFASSEGVEFILKNIFESDDISDQFGGGIPEASDEGITSGEDEASEAEASDEGASTS